MIYKDILGQELAVGNRIAYAKIGSGTDHGSLGIGKIVALKDTGKTENRWNTTSKTWELMPVLTATIEWETNSRHSMYPGFYDPLKKSTVTKFENMVKIIPATIGEV